MANRHFEDKGHLKLYEKYRITPPNNLIEFVLSYLKEKYDGDLNLAVDVGCGSGQNTFLYAPHFTKVLGTDISPNQIAIAKERNEYDNVNFEISGAEKLPVERNSVQLVTASAACHWFDLPKFFEEGRRVLCKNGVMALYVYTPDDNKFHWEADPSKNKRINENFFEQIFSVKSSTIAEFWPPQIPEYVLSKYRTITIPYQDFTRDEVSFYQKRRVNLLQVLGDLKSFSAFQRMKEIKGEAAAQKFIDETRERILSVIAQDLEGESQSDEEIFFEETVPYVLLIARKSED